MKDIRHPEEPNSITIEGSLEVSCSFTSRECKERFFPRTTCFTHSRLKVYQPLAGPTPKPKAYKSQEGNYVRMTEKYMFEEK